MSYSMKTINKKYTLSYRNFITHNNQIISPINDIPHFTGKNINVVCEIPRFESAKFEISMKEPKNPIKQDVKNSKLRFYPNIFPFKGSMWNYGAIPQTWENPNENDIFTGLKGDNDPIDVIEIGSVPKSVGEVYQAKVLGAVGLIDDGETDWKVLAIDVRDVLCDKLNDATDIEKYMPGLIKQTIFFFESYKTVDGKPKNTFYKNGDVMSVKETLAIINHAHSSWEKMEKCSTEPSLIETEEEPQTHESSYKFWFVLEK
ncbi:Inorganic pyrophosphatase [Cucumispora dikerogammari]|nr:Inorganic pyrophosphatase [Cucumispora dikerogammari]